VGTSQDAVRLNELTQTTGFECDKAVYEETGQPPNQVFTATLRVLHRAPTSSSGGLPVLIPFVTADGSGGTKKQAKYTAIAAVLDIIDGVHIPVPSVIAPPSPPAVITSDVASTEAPPPMHVAQPAHAGTGVGVGAGAGAGAGAGIDRKNQTTASPAADGNHVTERDRWSAEEVGQWLSGLGSVYANHALAFKSYGVNGRVLFGGEFGDEDLQELGVESKLMRKRILSEIAQEQE
jgi:hypothetical protein